MNYEKLSNILQNKARLSASALDQLLLDYPFVATGHWMKFQNSVSSEGWDKASLHLASLHSIDRLKLQEWAQGWKASKNTMNLESEASSLIVNKDAGIDTPDKLELSTSETDRIEHIALGKKNKSKESLDFLDWLETLKPMTDAIAKERIQKSKAVQAGEAKKSKPESKSKKKKKGKKRKKNEAKLLKDLSKRSLKQQDEIASGNFGRAFGQSR